MDPLPPLFPTRGVDSGGVFREVLRRGAVAVIGDDGAEVLVETRQDDETAAK